MRWVDYMNEFKNARLVILGRGPTLSLYDGVKSSDVAVSINAAASADFSISGHIISSHTKPGFTHPKSLLTIDPLIDISHHHIPIDSAPWSKIEPGNDWYMPLHHGNSFDPTRGEMAKYSCIPISVTGVAAVYLGWFFGCSSMIAYGCDGGVGYAKDFGNQPSPEGYAIHKKLMENAAKKCFGDNYHFISL